MAVIPGRGLRAILEFLGIVWNQSVVEPIATLTDPAGAVMQAGRFMVPRLGGGKALPSEIRDLVLSVAGDLYVETAHLQGEGHGFAP
jgi:hypothetical protein